MRYKFAQVQDARDLGRNIAEVELSAEGKRDDALDQLKLSVTVVRAVTLLGIIVVD